MRRRRIGVLDVSVVGLGCNQFATKIDAAQARSVVDTAIDVGINFFDTAPRYGHGDRPFSGRGRSEEFLGKALRGRRSQAVISTKFGNPHSEDPSDRSGRPADVRAACERSLRRLDTDYIDLFSIHRPDPDTPVAETLGALNALVAEGKVREIGCSNYTLAQLQEAVGAATGHSVRSYATVQNEYSLLVRGAERDVLPFCQRHGLAFVPYFPLASGLLTGKYRAHAALPADSRLAQAPPNRPHLAPDDANLERVERLRGFAEARGHTLLELAIGWLLGREAVASVIAGATRPEQVRANAAAASWQLSAADYAAVDAIDRSA